MIRVRYFRFAFLLATIVFLPLQAQQVCPCVPVTKLWVSTVCTDWNCTMTALADAKGDPMVFAVPVAMNDSRWLIVRQVTAGAYVDDSPFAVESFDGVAQATARFASMTSDSRPHIVSSPDGKLLVISLRQPESDQTASRRRAIRGH